MIRKIICLDPGHGGYDPGACAGGAREKDITLHIGLQLRDLLQRANFGVVMTRETDVSPGGYTNVNADLRERCRIANVANADVFLSIHVNAGGGRGAEIYACGDGGPIAPLAKNIVESVGSIMAYHGQPVRDGGANGAGWAVIRGTTADAMLLEIGFIDSDDLAKIQQNIDEFAPLISRAFCEFYGVPQPAAAEPSKASLPFGANDAEKVIAVLGALHQASGDAAVQTASHIAANDLRVAIGTLPAADEGPVIDRTAAQIVIDHLGTLHKASADAGVREAAHYAADALRNAAGIPNNQ